MILLIAAVKFLGRVALVRILERPFEYGTVEYGSVSNTRQIENPIENLIGKKLVT